MFVDPILLLCMGTCPYCEHNPISFVRELHSPRQLDKMLEDVLNSIIGRFLGEYIKDIDKKDLKVSMWKGDVKLKNLVL